MPERAFQDLGELLTKALMTGDFGLYCSIFNLPIAITTKEGVSYKLADEVALREDFDLYVAIINLHGVTDVYLQVLGFDHVEPGKIWVRLKTHILVRANLLVEPFATQMLLQQGTDGWRIAEIESSEGHVNWTLGRAVVSPAGRFQAKEAED